LTKSSIRSGSSIQEYPTDLRVHLFLRPLRVLVLQEGCFVVSRRPVQTVRSPPPLLRRHPAQNLELLFGGLFVSQHGVNVPRVT
jgi:hypothetical protein